eukprot:7562016-Ditylum_brightwellii.AAC.1
MVKWISVRMLHVISQSAVLDTLCGDTGNTFVNAHTIEKVHTRAGLELWPELCGENVINCKALYCLAMSCTHFYDRLVDILQSIGFQQCTGFNHDVWICYSEESNAHE